MIEHKYIVVSAGERVEGVGDKLLRERLAPALGAAAAARLVTLSAGQSAALRRFETREAADQFVSSLRQLGLVCWLRMLRPEENPELLLEAALDANAAAVPGAPSAGERPTTPGRALLSGRRRWLAAGVALCLLGGVSAWALWPGSRAAAPALAVQAPTAAAATAPQPASGAPTEPTPRQVSFTPRVVIPDPVVVDLPPPSAPAASSAARAKTEEATPRAASPAAESRPAPASEPAAVKVASAEPPAAASRPSEPAQLLANRESLLAPAHVPAADVIVPPSYDRAKVRQPAYPPQALRNNEQGEVRLLVVVGADGAPRRVDVHQSSGSVLLDRAAQDAVKNWRFRPGTRNGVPQESTGEVTVAFKLDEEQ